MYLYHLISIDLQLSRSFNPSHCKAYNISIDFYKLLVDRDGYNIVIILVNCFGKRPFLIPCYKNINTKEAAQLYIHYIY